ncbi:uncharacterized protein LOC133781482 [Humulus lupulus]|uniref:uncharacterized protein LOC133781482 n=1 Tax=Humulus lupulus TaxID=3486 RepID=UPI002B40D640|nr:uncharacterized protein LOC133781482 [Humulus lupulus]
MPKYLLPLTDHFPGRVTYRGNGYFKTIKDKFEELGLIERVKESPFKQFFMAEKLDFSASLMHQLMLRKIQCFKEDELHLHLGSRPCRFGRGEFALVTGLNFSSGPSETDLKKHLTSDRLIKEYFNDEETVKLMHLEAALKNCTIVEDAYKLGLCFFVEGVLLAREGKLNVWIDSLKMVEDTEYFFTYPWGKVSFNKLMDSCKKDMHHQKRNYEKKKEVKGKQKEAKYSLYGYVPALQYWAYEAIQQFAREYGINHGNQFPRMLSWSSNKERPISKADLAPMFKKTSLIVLSMLKPRPSEIDYYSALTEGDAPLYPGLGQEEEVETPTDFEKVAEIAAEVAKAANIFVDGPDDEDTPAPIDPTPSAPAPSVHPSPDQPDLREVLERLERVESRQDTILENQAVIMDVVNKILTFVQDLPNDSDSDSDSLDLPDDFVSHDIGTPPPIVLTANPETPGVAIIEPGDVVGVEFQLAKRKRRKPKKFEDYTDPTRKKARLDAIDDVPLVLDPLKKPLATQYRTVGKWLLGDIPNKTKRDVQSGVYGPSWFLTMKTPQFWIDDGHIDAAMHMLRRRRQFYPGAYRQDGVVMNIMFSQVVPARYDAYQTAKEADKKRFLWDSDVISMITGIDNQFLASWKGVDTVYWCQNYLQAHWFAVEASISTWTLNVYDSDVTVISDKQLQSFMKSWSTLFPSLLLQSQLFKDDPRLTIPPGAKRCKEFNVHRMPVDSVPQTKVSGDCGVYAIKHIEHLLGRLPLDTICDDNMKLFRNKWTVDLWYQNVRH